MPRLKSIVQLSTNHSFKQPIHHSIYFTRNFGNSYDLSKDFNAYDWILLSDVYIYESSLLNHRTKLREFFCELGISDFLFPITDSTYEQFNSLIQIQSVSMNRKLFLVLQELYSNFCDNEKFIKHLRQSIWIPTIQIFYSYNEQKDQIELNRISKLDKPNNIYIKNKQIQQIFGQHVQYVDVDIDFNSSFRAAIGLIEHVTLNDICSMLLHWCKNSIFYTSMSHMQNIYEYISQNMNMNELRNLINSQSIFFIPVSSSLPSNRTNIVRGRFVNIVEVYWHDSTNLFVKYSSSLKMMNFIFLEQYYIEQKSIFIDSFSIRLNPTVEDYINLLSINLFKY